MKIQYVIAIHLIRWLTNFYDFSFKSTATAAIGIHPTKAWLSLLVNFKNAIWTWGHFHHHHIALVARISLTLSRHSSLSFIALGRSSGQERYALKFCFKLVKNATKTFGMLQTAFGASCINRASVFEWHKTFKEGRESVRDDERCGRSEEVNTPELIDQRVRVRVTMLRF